MSYAIRAGENLSRALKRVSRAELRKARHALDAPGPGTAAQDAHALRLATKKVRAIARLVEPVVGRRARQANREIGGCADVMAAVRDADAAVRTFEELRAGLPARMRSATDAVREALADRLRHQAQEMDPVGDGKRTLRKLRRALHHQQDHVARWLPSSKSARDGSGRKAAFGSGDKNGGKRGDKTGRKSAGKTEGKTPGKTAWKHQWKYVGPGLEAGYRRARKAMRRAYRAPNGDTFHAWRRAVKAHRYQLRVLSSWAPRELAPRTADLGRLAELLGDEHDLTMLRRTLRANRFWFGDESETYYEVIRRIDQQRREKRLQALPLGEQLFAERPRDLARRMRQHLRGFRDAPIQPPNAAEVA